MPKKKLLLSEKVREDWTPAELIALSNAYVPQLRGLLWLGQWRISTFVVDDFGDGSDKWRFVHTMRVFHREEYLDARIELNLASINNATMSSSAIVRSMLHELVHLKLCGFSQVETAWENALAPRDGDNYESRTWKTITREQLDETYRYQLERATTGLEAVIWSFIEEYLDWFEKE